MPISHRRPQLCLILQQATTAQNHVILVLKVALRENMKNLDIHFVNDQAPHACETCKKRKRKCDKGLPQCSGCLRLVGSISNVKQLSEVQIVRASIADILFLVQSFMMYSPIMY